MNVTVKYDDIKKYYKGEEIIASPPEHAREIFGHFNDHELVNILINPLKIIDKDKKTVRGMTRGDFTFYTIQDI
ncbi:hypothetical protein [Paenibacillus odorifer]|uniref:hypothetical protein n=1 Tax=Paenibacillus odorifer TaxID=189426 RepID=UPI001C4C3B30|nr:hypothetical protein [Paenibacillus odorifer]